MVYFLPILHASSLRHSPFSAFIPCRPLLCVSIHALVHAQTASFKMVQIFSAPKETLFWSLSTDRSLLLLLSYFSSIPSIWHLKTYSFVIFLLLSCTILTSVWIFPFFMCACSIVLKKINFLEDSKNALCIYIFPGV